MSKLTLDALAVGALLPTFCPTDLNLAAQTRITLNSQSAKSPADQGECDSDESCRTEQEVSRPAETARWRETLTAKHTDTW